MLGYQYLRKIEFQSPKLHVPCLFHLRDLLRMMVTKSQSPEIAAIKYPRAPMIGMSNSDGPMANDHGESQSTGGTFQPRYDIFQSNVFKLYSQFAAFDLFQCRL